MSSRILSLAGLKECIGRGNPVEAKDILENVSKFFDDQLSKAELELGLETLFNTEFGTIAFLNRSIREQKKFSECNANIFSIWVKILQEPGAVVKFEPYVQDIIQCATRFIISTQVSAKEKEKSAIVLQEIFKNKLTDDIDASELVSKLIDVFNTKNRPGTFSQQIFILLGVISRDTPENISQKNIDIIRNILIKALEDVVLNEQTVQYNALAGAMEGLSLFLMNFAPSPTEHQNICDSIYVCVKKLSNPPLYVKAKAPFRCSLDLFTRHYQLFTHQIYRDFKYWQECLSSESWLSSTIYEDRRKGIFAMQSFHKAIEHEFNKKELTNGDKNILLFLINSFRSTLESAESKPYQTRIAIRGFGLMAKMCKQLLPEILKEVLSLVIQRTELISLAEDNELRDSLEHFPDYVEALSLIIREVGHEDENIAHILAQSIQSILIRLIRDFHYLSKAHTNLASNAICTTLFNLSELNGTLFNGILDKIILQGIIWTCSHKLVYDANADWENSINWKDNITYKYYLDLWHNLLSETAHCNYDKPFIAKQIFNSLIGNLLIILDKLNLKTKRRVFAGEDGEDQEFYFCDPNIDLCPKNAQDFHIFFNLVDFYRDILFSKYNWNYFHDWIEEYCTKMINYIVENPLVSGFLKLLECGLTLADRLNYFKANNENEILSNSLSLLLKNIIIKSQKYSGELQLACLELILKFPIEFYKNYILDLITIFKITFELGKSTIWLAKLGITSLEKISVRFDEDSNFSRLEKFYEEVLPQLDCYLQSKGFEEQHFSAEIVTYRNNKRIKKSTFAQRIESTELFEVQKRIFNLLSKLQPQEAVLILDKNAAGEDLVKWRVEQNIKINLYYQGVRLEIYLDSIIPRICHLACTSIDRKTKIAACELVHALVLYLLGAKIHKGILWEELCSKILVLGADNDVTIQQMFEPLLRQLMHYMSKYENLEKGVDILMKVLLDGISNDNNCAIRDVSAICIREFVEWSIKQTTPQQLAASPVSIEVILNQLRMYSFDSSLSRRIGSALAFNNLYRKLREEESICDLFFIDLLYTFCVNFKLTEELGTASFGSINSDLEQVSLSLDHILRVLKQRSYLFRKPNSSRKIPPAIGSANTVVLKDVVVYLLGESKNKLMNYRTKCLAMVLNLSTTVENVSSLSIFFSNNVTLDFITNFCEGPANGLGIKARTTLSEFNKLPSESRYSVIYNWMQYLLCSLDCYIWLLNHNALKEPKALFVNAKIFQAVCYYFDKICWKTVFQLIESLDSDILSIDSTDSIRNLELEEINRINAIKCIIKSQIMKFIIAVLNSGCSNEIPDIFWSMKQKENLIEFICDILYDPSNFSNLEFELKFKEITVNYLDNVLRLIKSIQLHCLNQELFEQIIKKIGLNLMINIKMFIDKADQLLYSEQISERNWNIAKGVLFTLNNIEMNEILDFENLLQLGKDLILNLFNGIFEIIFNTETTTNLQPNVKKFSNLLLKISFAIGEVLSTSARENISATFVGCLLDEKLIVIRGTLRNIKHGEHFFSVYKRAIFEYCNESFIESIIPIIFSNLCKSNAYFIIKVMTEIIEFCYMRKQHDQGVLQTLVDVNLRYFPKICEILQSNNELPLVVDYIISLGHACPISWKLCVYKSKQPELENYILGKLKDKTCSLEQKSKVFNILPLIIGVDDYVHVELTEALKDVQSQHFPLRSSEFRKNSIEETGLKVAFKTLLDALICSKSYVILDFILQSTVADQKHIVEYMIKEDLNIYVHSLNKGNSSVQQNLVLEKIFEKCNNDNFEPQIRITIMDRFLLPIIKNSSCDAVVAFYMATFPTIALLIDTKFGFAKQGWAVEHALVNRILGFSLIEIFFGLLPKEKYYYSECPLISAMLSNEKSPSKFVGTISKKAFYARIDVFVTDDSQTKEFFRKYQCAAYKALSAIICNTQTDMKFYLKFLFEEIPQKNEFIWMKLIDCGEGKIYIHESQEMESYARTKERFVSIRRLNPVSSSEIFGQSQVSSSKYLQTQNVFSSSLSQDVNRIDLNYSMVRGDAEAAGRKESLLNEVVSVKLERTELNKHEIMPTLCGVIQHMHENGITPLINDPVQAKRTYPWIVCIANTIENFSNHKNIRVFLAQVVDNCRNVFEPYAHILFKPILQLLFDECAGKKLNFFITDMIALLLSWSKHELHIPTSLEEIRLSSALLQFLMKNAWNDNKQIFKYNLELIQTMISLWKDCLEIPHTFLLDIIQVSERSDSKENELGLVLAGIMFANGLIPWIERTKNYFIKKVFSNMNNDYAAVYQPAAHVYGMILGVLDKDQDLEILESAKFELVDKLKGLANKRESKKEKYFKDILYAVHKNYPEILDSFKETISYKIPSAIGTIKKFYLEMILTRLEAYNSDEIYNIIISIGVKDLLKMEDYKLLALHILNKSLPKLNWKEIQSLFQLIEDCVNSSKVECRDVTYEILIYISQNVNLNSEIDSPKNELKKKSDVLLLKGLMDTDGEIQKRIFYFWSQETNLSQNIGERIFSLISNYSLNCEQQFLGFCTQLILEPAIQNPESKQQIFQFESDRDNKLQEYEINTNSRVRTTCSMPPLFADAQNKFISRTNYNFIRETPNEYFFEPTKNPIELSQIRTQFTLPTQSSLPFTIKPYTLNRRSQKLPGLETVTLLETNEKAYDNSLRKRFLKDKEKETRETSLRVIDQRSRKQAINHGSNRDGKVILYRRYRIGDYPDLLINNLAFLLPLQGIVKRDRYIARQIFVSIFTSLIKMLGPEANQYITSIGHKIQNIFDESKSCDPIVFSTFLEMALLKTEAFNFRPETVSMIAKACNMQTIAAIYLETRINVDFDETESGPSTKSSSYTTNCERHWIELSDIYNSLAEYDIVTEIFADKVDADPRLTEAIQLKASGRYKEAQTLLLKIIERRRPVEQNFSYNCFYECFEELGDWTMLTSAIQQQIDDFEELWVDEYNTNYFLPKIIKAELQLILKAQPYSNEFLGILLNWMKSDQVKADYIKQTFCEELMMLQIANANYRQSRVHCEDHLKKFLLEWSVMSTHYDKLRQESILNAQKIAEIDYYALLLLEQFDERVIGILTKKWNNCRIDKSDSLRYWNGLLGYRIYIAGLFIANLENLNSQNDFIENLQNSINKLLFQLIDAAIYQKNYGIANNLINDLSSLRNIAQNSIHLEYEIAQVKAILLQADDIAGKSNCIENLDQAWIQIHNVINDNGLEEKLSLKMEAFQLKSKISEKIFKKLPTFTGLTSQILEKFSRYISHDVQSKDFKYKMLEESFWCLKDSVEFAENFENDNFNNQICVEGACANAHYKLAEFCYEYHQISEPDIAFRLESTLISSVFHAMRHNSPESRELFPCVLQLPSLENGILSELFIKNSNIVPEWMFLNWIPQILSRFKVEHSTYIDDLVLRIAKAYPNALVYQFHTWLDQEKISIKNSVTLRSEMGNVINLLRNPLLEKFIRGLKNLRYPHLQLESWIRKFLTNFPENKKNFLDMFDEVMAFFDLNDDFHGSIYRDILPYKQTIEELKNLDVLKDRAHIYKVMNDLNAKILTSVKRNDKYLRLELFCPWLSNFHWCGEDTFIELPGQYYGDNRPILEQNIKIVKFDQKVEIFQSMRRPMRIKVFGSNAKTYDFIIKFGEDLQQDQRIQQALNIMSLKLNKDRQCRNHNLFIRTYKVIPLDLNGGMISFIYDTTTMDNFISECFTRRDPQAQQFLNKCIKDYLKFIKNPTKHHAQIKEEDVYGTAVTTYTRDQIIANFRNVENNIDTNLLKNALVDMSVSPESFYTIRNNFAKSLAAMNVSHWILGIGDRHLQNILISTKDGSLAGIDFSVVLGGGIQNLTIPELIPFRLTSQFVNALKPMGTSGILFKCMAHVLRVYRSSPKPLLACIEIFARIPTQDWIALQNIIQLDWKPTDRINIVKRKLGGDNPMQLVKKDLQDSATAKQSTLYKDNYEKILQGNYQFNVRSRLPDKNLTVEEQIKCLIDLATDPAILGCSYVGLNAWL